MCDPQVLGINAATLVHAAAAGLGLSAVLAQSALAFGVLKAVGALYLIYLGIRTLVPAKQPSEAAAAGEASRMRAVREAFLTGLLNPAPGAGFGRHPGGDGHGVCGGSGHAHFERHVLVQLAAGHHVALACDRRGSHCPRYWARFLRAAIARRE